MIKTFLTFSLLAFSASSFAAGENIFPEFTDYFSTRFVGKSAQGSKTFDDTTCVVPNPFGGCSQKAGSKVEGSATATVTAYTDSWGTMQMASDPFEDYNLVKSDATVVFRYEGRTIGRRYSVPGGAFVEHAWGWLNPKGNIIIRIESSAKQYYKISVSYEVVEGHGDRPNATAEAAAYNMKMDAKNIVQEFLRSKNVPAEITIN